MLIGKILIVLSFIIFSPVNSISSEDYGKHVQPTEEPESAKPHTKEMENQPSEVTPKRSTAEQSKIGSSWFSKQYGSAKPHTKEMENQPSEVAPKRSAAEQSKIGSSWFNKW